MAPRKKADEKASSTEAADTILNYLRKQNRPYSASDISANLHNKVTKAVTAKILKELHDQAKVEGRPAGRQAPILCSVLPAKSCLGKQIVYHYPQSPSDSCTPEQLAVLDTRIANHRDETIDLQATAKTLRSSLSSLNSTLSTADLASSINLLELEKSEAVTRLNSFEAGNVKKVSKEERGQVEMEWKKWKEVRGQRGKVVREMWMLIDDLLQDGEKEVVRERLGLDEETT